MSNWSPINILFCFFSIFFFGCLAFGCLRNLRWPWRPWLIVVTVIGIESGIVNPRTAICSKNYIFGLRRGFALYSRPSALWKLPSRVKTSLKAPIFEILRVEKVLLKFIAVESFSDPFLIPRPLFFSLRSKTPFQRVKFCVKCPRIGKYCIIGKFS